MKNIVLGLLAVSSVFMSGCALEAGEGGGGEDNLSSVDQALIALIFKGGGNSGISNQSDKTLTIAADNARHNSALGGIGINIRVDDVAPFVAGSITSADCKKRTVSVTYKQADIKQFTTTTPPGSVHNGRCIATVSLTWSAGRPAGSVSFPAPSINASEQRVFLPAMPVTPAVGNITVVTKTNGVANNDKYDFRLDP